MSHLSKVNWSGHRVLITGGGGFIGSHLCRQLLDRGCEVHATSRTQRTNSKDGPVWWQLNIEDIAMTRRLITEVKPDVIYHLAGSVSAGVDYELILPTYMSLLTGTVNMLMAATEAGCHRIIMTGSLTEPLPELNVTPQSPYSAAKGAAANYGRMFHRLYQTPVVILRPFMVYGPGQATSKLIPYVILSLLKGEDPELSSGKHQFDWLYIDDATEGFIKAMTTPAIEGATIDLGSGKLVYIADLIKRIARMIDGPGQVKFGALPDRLGENEITANTAEASSLLGWRTTTTLDSGLKKTVEWYRTRQDLIS